MNGRLRNESGQAMLMTVVFVTALLGCVALTLDVGSWYREHRQAQATADAAALAGAQALPGNPAQAYDSATQYANANGAGVASDGIQIRSDIGPNDTVAVQVARTAPGFFAKLFGIDSTTVRAAAAARAGIPYQVNHVAPVVVNKRHPDLAGAGCPCFHTETTLPLSRNGAPGGFDLINLDQSGQNHGQSELAGWITDGYDAYLGRGDYYQETGTKFNGNDMNQAFAARTGTELLFPVYDTITGNGSNAIYNIIGWVGFHLDGATKDSGNNWRLTGYFTTYIADGILSRRTPSNASDFGVHTISLVN